MNITGKNEPSAPRTPHHSTVAALTWGQTCMLQQLPDFHKIQRDFFK